MEEVEKRLLEEVQRRFPLEERPYAVLAQRLGLSEEEVIRRLEDLKVRGLLRQISAIFHPQALGYQTTLVAASFSEEQVEEAASLINAYPGVSHNYLREHFFNLWFTIAVPPDEELESRVAALMQEAGARRYLLLPIRRVFRISLVLDLSENDEETVPGPRGEVIRKPKLDQKTISLVKVTQEDLPREPFPFACWGKALGVGAQEVLAWLRQGLKDGFIRRFAGLVRHTRAGFRGNVMVAWKVPAERVEEVGQALAGEKKITHCYERQSYPDWPYNLYTMIHAHHEKEALDYVKELSHRHCVSEYLPLVTRREFKKVRLKLFW